MWFRRLKRVLCVAAAAGGCDGTPTAPDPSAPEPLRVVVAHRQDTGENILLRTDGAPAGALDGGVTGLIPIGVTPEQRELALLDTAGGGRLLVSSLERIDRLDTIIAPTPTSMSLVSFSANARYVAVVSYAPERVVLIYDRANRTTDTLPLGVHDPALPPLLGPDNDRVALIAVTPTSAILTVLFRSDPTRLIANTLGFSRVINRPIFGWPRWTSDGIAFAVVRVADAAPDTLLVVQIDPDEPAAPLQEQYRAVMSPVSDGQPELQLGTVSTYALAADGRALVLGAHPGASGARHAIYLVTPARDRVQLLLDDPAQFPVFPLFIE